MAKSVSQLKVVSSQQAPCLLCSMSKTTTLGAICTQESLPRLVPPSLPSHTHLVVLAAFSLGMCFSHLFHLLTCLGLCSQPADAELAPPAADRTAHHPGGGQLLPHAHLHDLQRVPVHRRGRRSRHRILLLQLEKGSGGGYHRALPLTLGVPSGLSTPSLQEQPPKDWSIPKLPRE